MAAVSLGIDDLRVFAPDIVKVRAKAEAMIADALALAAQVAPCILDDDFEHADAAKAILRGAILRWNDTGAGAVTTQTAGQFSQTVDTRTTRRGMFWPSEITDLARLCGSSSSGRAFTIDMAPDAAWPASDMGWP